MGVLIATIPKYQKNKNEDENKTHHRNYRNHIDCCVDNVLIVCNLSSDSTKIKNKR